ncbi:MAG: DUF3108 domain-containing protein [Betaproteobacteria bacterium]|nr:DUF3108 domain-containing protein [Betaproteobacteria bacterium]
MKLGWLVGRRAGGFGIALTVSILFHLLLLFAPAWQVPVSVEPVRIEASLRMPPTRLAAVKPVEQPATQQKKPALKPIKHKAAANALHAGAQPKVLASAEKTAQAPEIAVPSGAGDDAPPPATEQSGAAMTEPLAQTDPAPPPQDSFPVTVDPEATVVWPHSGRIVFQVRYGAGLDIGRMIHTWSHDGERYTMRAEMETVGLARMIHKFSAVQQSQGRVGPEGLAPTGFQEDLNGKQSHAIFDWNAHKVIMSRPDRVREEALNGVAQDILSLAHHLAFQPDTMETLDIFVVAGRWGAHATLSQVANERLRLPWGQIETRHFHCEANGGEFGIDIWLSREHRNAPVRIRVDDRKQGHVVDEIALEMELDDQRIEFRPSTEEREMYKG